MRNLVALLIILFMATGCAGLSQIASDVCHLGLDGSKAVVACDVVEDFLTTADEDTSEDVE